MHAKTIARALVVLVLLVGCSDDTSGPDLEAPSVEILAAPTSVNAGQPVEINYRATDDAGLSTVSISWGTLDAPVEVRFPTGTVSEGDASHVYADPGEYRITVSASDERGRMASDFVTTTVEP